MRFRGRQSGWLLLLLLLAAFVMSVAGCASTDSENVSSRPWDQPQGWETGALPGMNNYR